MWRINYGRISGETPPSDIDTVHTAHNGSRSVCIFPMLLSERRLFGIPLYIDTHTQAFECMLPIVFTFPRLACLCSAVRLTGSLLLPGDLGATENAAGARAVDVYPPSVFTTTSIAWTNRRGAGMLRHAGLLNIQNLLCKHTHTLAALTDPPLSSVVLTCSGSDVTVGGLIWVSRHPEDS